MTIHEDASILSERLTMRSLTPADEAFYCSLYTDAQVLQHVHGPQSLAEAREGFRKVLDDMRQPEFKRRVLVLIDRETQEPIGISSIRMLRDRPGHAEVGTLLQTGAHERGFGLECSEALISQAFTRKQIDTLVARAANGNAKVEKLMTDLGFTRGSTRPNGHAEWTVTRDAWSKRAAGKSTQSK
jgi:RimJ/RimL family protein N-acetyltransferase